MLLPFKWIDAPGYRNPGKTASQRGKIKPEDTGAATNLIARPPPPAYKL